MQNENNPSCRYLGIDIGGTRIKWGVIDAKGTIVRRGLADTCPEKGAEYFLRHAVCSGRKCRPHRGSWHLHRRHCGQPCGHRAGRY